MKSRNKLIIRWIFYLLGLLILALGIMLNTKANGHMLLGLGLGTIFSMIGVGRVIAVFNKLFKERMKAVAFDYVEE